MKSVPKLLMGSVLMILSGCQAVGRDPLLRLSFHAVDGEGKVVGGAKVSFSAEARPRGAGDESGRQNGTSGLTDSQGLYTGEVEAWDATQSGYQVTKEGYYPAWSSYSAKAAIRGKWQPWNPVIEVVLKRVRNPVPMYAKRVSGEVPAKDTDAGYDLIMGDWVAPHGKGKVADMTFHGTGEVLGDRNYRGVLTVTFPGQGNGMIPHEVSQPQPSPLRMPYEAPADGYEAKRVWRSVRKYNPVAMKNEEYINDSSKTRNFFIRVRGEMDADGKMVKALYGKIHAPFDFDARGEDPSGRTKKQWVGFTYYLNPDGTRNIEFDPKRNLLKPTNRDDSDFQGLAP